MVEDDQGLNSTSKKKITRPFGALNPKSRNSGKQLSSLSSASIPVVATTLPKPSTMSTLPAATKRSTDDNRTMSRYSGAAKALKDVVECGRRNWEGFAPPVAETVAENSSQLQEELQKVLHAWNVLSKNQGLCSSGKRLLKQIYIATSPFAKHFLLVAKDAVQTPVLNPYGLVAGGLMLFIAVSSFVVLLIQKIADREVSRKELIQKDVEYICRQLEQLNVIEHLPDTDDPPTQLRNRATDVLSASLHYLAVHIRRESGRFGVVGNIVVTIPKGDEKCATVGTELRVAVEEFNSALANFSARIGFRMLAVGSQTLGISPRGLETGRRNLEVGNRTLEIVDGLRQNLSFSQADQIRSVDSMFTASEDNFIVPYQRNPHFKGRSELLMELYNTLCKTESDQYNHRVALYGLGGVGKTQLALEYVHTHWQKKTYKRVYWASAVSQATLFTDLKEIGVRTHCLPENKDLKPSEMGKVVLHWLNKQENWLLVIDNLDDVTVVKGFLPEAGPRRHTLITTRNQHCDDIPAEGLEVGVMGIAEATELLLTRAKVQSDVEEMSGIKLEADEIVKELGFLPLAIEQAAAYIREASHDIFQFLPSYRNDRRFYHARRQKGNRTYANSLATTWHLSFRQVEQNSHEAAELLRLLAFLNPDGVLIEFLERGMEGLTAELQALIADRKQVFDALAELTRFSLIRRHNQGLVPRITVHRLVQSIIQDDMSLPQFSAMTMTVIRLCESGFPRSDSGDWETRELRQLGRKYQEQVLPPLRALNRFKSVEMGMLSERVGIFLEADGNFQQAREFFEKAVDIMKSVNGEQGSDTLRVMGRLACSYRDEGKWDEAQKLQEKVLELRERLLGQEHPDTLTAMAHLAVTYWEQGKWDEAQKLEEKVLELSERLLGQEHPDTLNAMANLAGTYRCQGKWDEAQKLQEKVLELRERLLGQEHPDTLTAMANLAVTYWEQGKWDEAQKLQEKVLELRERLLGQEHPHTLSAMANLAATYRSLGAISRSIELLEMAVDKRNRIVGPEHPDTLRTRYQLALSYQKDGRLRLVITILEDTLEAQIRILGEKHPQTRDTAAALEASKEGQNGTTFKVSSLNPVAERQEDCKDQEISLPLNGYGGLNSNAILE